MSKSEDRRKSIYYPPGGILVWLFIVLEVATFTMGLLTFAYQRMGNAQLFNTSRQMLDVSSGTVNTIVLLTSGFFMAEALAVFKKEGGSRRCNLLMLGTISLGGLFLLLKGIEYSSKLAKGIGLEHNQFFTYYWLLTGFHFLHVVVGLAILIGINLRIRAGHYNEKDCLDVESAAAFWHMCDVIWLMLFPVMYLLR